MRTNSPWLKSTILPTNGHKFPELPYKNSINYSNSNHRKLKLSFQCWSSSTRKLHLESVDSIERIGRAEWDSCHDGGNPFVKYDFLHALELSKSACARSGWTPAHLVARDGQTNELIIACPMYLKSHSYGEYVFDQGWAEFCEMNTRQRYYPKLQSSVPFTPCCAPKILVKPGLSSREHLMESFIAAMRELPKGMGVSSLHVTFNTDEEMQKMANGGFLTRYGVQFHWRNQKYHSFDDFLGVLKQKKRKAIRQERKRVLNSVDIRQLTGDDLKNQKELWDAFYACYSFTVDRKWGVPYLTRDFFTIISETMADDILLVMAYSDQNCTEPIAGALNFIGKDVLFGRNWGCLPGTEIDCLHFELCYYQAIEYAIANGLSKIEAGAQGEHKVRRGYVPTITYSNHLIENRNLSSAVEEFLAREKRDIAAYAESLIAYESPYK
eukprot:jgi/Picsp_1/3100/NSC_05941-R1_protein of hypothetical function duf482